MTDFELLKKDLPPEEMAVELRHQGFSCCQAVVGVLTDDPLLLQAASGFGGGMGNTQGPCGALIGAVIAAGVKTEGKGRGRVTNQLRDKFRESCGAVICRDLKGLDTGTVLCSCDDCVRSGVKVFREVLGD